MDADLRMSAAAIAAAAAAAPLICLPPGILSADVMEDFAACQCDNIKRLRRLAGGCLLAATAADADFDNNYDD